MQRAAEVHLPSKPCWSFPAALEGCTSHPWHLCCCQHHHLEKYERLGICQGGAPGEQAGVNMVHGFSAKPVEVISLKDLPADVACALCLLLVGTPSAPSAAGLHLHYRQFTAREPCRKDAGSGKTLHTSCSCQLPWLCQPCPWGLPSSGLTSVPAEAHFRGLW